VNSKLKNILKISVFSGFVIIAVILTGHIRSASAESVSGDENLSLSLVNEYRSNAGLPRLEWSDKLAQAAQDKAEDMKSDKYFEHQAPDGRVAWDFIIEEGYDYSKAGENLAIDFKNVHDATDAWELSPSHLRNIASPDYTEFGFAQTSANIEGRPTIVFVQLFAKPQSIYDRALENMTK